MQISPMETGHVGAISTLCRQLGYCVNEVDLVGRLPHISNHPDHSLLVALEQDRVIGWAHGMIQSTLISGRLLLIVAMVVDEACRGEGVGGSLLLALEEWAVAEGCGGARVASRITRDRAHAFYLRRGYQKEKVSQVFIKALPDAAV